ncbi:AraC family transcriptional regulator [Luteibacter yeojuensis]|uniref:AraC family transcriptional regulator n=2 Tax=Luteibacter yeojuensis TaxID=345309 RepID=A0A0F3L259_9GAMM|nr:AraC family transcriptional regulator [Luteibacter yeojuensis]
MLESSPCMLNRTDMADDPISEILRLAEFESVMSGGFTVGGDWAVRFPPPDKLKFFAVARGRVVMRIDGEPRDIVMGEGDVILVSAGRSFVLASDPDLPARFASEFAWHGPERLVAFNDGTDTLQIGGHVRVHPAYEAMLLAALPPWIHIAGNTPEATTMRWLIDQMVKESQQALPGAGIAQAQLAHLLFVQVLRAHMATGDVLPPGWLRAVADPRLAPVLRQVHAAPGRDWRLDEMARLAAMSRTVFAGHFRKVAGTAPLTYVTEWRMRLACQALHRGSVPVATLARDLGYGSESAFSHAFKRVVGVSPARYAPAA